MFFYNKCFWAHLNVLCCLWKSLGVKLEFHGQTTFMCLWPLGSWRKVKMGFHHVAKCLGGYLHVVCATYGCMYAIVGVKIAVKFGTFA